MLAIKWLNLAAIFLLELGLLAALGSWGFHAGGGGFAGLALGLGAALAFAVVWGCFMAPKARYPLAAAPHLAAEVALFGLGALALAAAGHPRLALAFALAWLLTRIIARLVDRRDD